MLVSELTFLVEQRVCGVEMSDLLCLAAGINSNLISDDMADLQRQGIAMDDNNNNPLPKIIPPPPKNPLPKLICSSPIWDNLPSGHQRYPLKGLNLGCIYWGQKHSSE